jgi:hypothetical protein
MRALLAVPAVVLLAGALLLTGGSAPRAGAHRVVLAASAVSACSSASDCVKGCTIPVSSAPRTPGSPTSPCSKSSPLTVCEEYVVNATPRPGGSRCGQGSPTFGELLPSPRLLRRKGGHAEGSLRSLDHLFRSFTRPGAHSHAGAEASSPR